MKARRILFSVAAFAAMLLVWEFAVRSFDFAEYMLPPPSEVAMYLWGAVCDLSLPKAVWVTGKRLFTGYAIGLCVGIPTGMLCSRFNIFKDTVGILALGLQALPSVVLGAACDNVVRAGGIRDAVCRRNGTVCR